MIIDDDQDINNLFKIYLEHNGCQVDSYTNPIDALYYFKKGRYDLIPLDLKMPQIVGITMFQALKKRPKSNYLLNYCRFIIFGTTKRKDSKYRKIRNTQTHLIEKSKK